MRDRHGRLTDGVLGEGGGAERDLDILLRYGNLIDVAGQVFRNRNAQGASKYPDIKAQVRPAMRHSLHSALRLATEARAALIAGDATHFELYLAQAKIELEAAKYPLRAAEMPYMLTGKKFKEGRKAGTVGPIRKAIAKLLKISPTMKTADVWKALAKRPPTGWTFYDSARLGKYAEGKTPSDAMAFARFSNVCAEERKKLRA